VSRCVGSRSSTFGSNALPCRTNAHTLAKAARLAHDGVPTVHGAAPLPSASSAFVGVASSSAEDTDSSRFVDTEHVQTVFR
jgi:hypothetical protein